MKGSLNITVRVPKLCKMISCVVLLNLLIYCMNYHDEVTKIIYAVLYIHT
uniref:Uncharacterized protein n=1 Tax=Anguilla anguilla TaxID=7936 RepID=A0A0E9QIT5_ANGAN